MTDKTTSKLLGRLKLPANCRVVTIGTVIGVVGAEAMRPQPDVPVSPSTSPAMKPLGKTGLMVPASWINKTEEAMRTGTIFGICSGHRNAAGVNPAGTGFADTMRT